MLLCLAVSLLVAASAAATPDIQVGDSYERVVTLQGRPEREVRTDSGVLLFYGRLLVGVEAGLVTFLSRSESVVAGAGGGVPAPPLPAAPSSQAPVHEDAKLLQLAGNDRPRTWIEEGQDRQVKLFAERIRRCIALEVYDRMLLRIPWRAYYERRHSSYAGLERRFGPSSGTGYGSDVQADGVSFLDLKDSQSVQVARHGEALRYSDRLVAVQQTVHLSGALSAAQ
jgi:hypothetical protein